MSYAFTMTSCGAKQVSPSISQSCPDDDANQVKAYLSNGRGTVKGVKEKNVAEYKVIYEAVYSKFIDPSPYSGGKQNEYFTLIKETDNSLWLIDDAGQP